MRVDQTQTTTGPNDLLVGAVMDLALVAAFLLSMGSTPVRHATSSVESAKPEAAELASPTQDGASPSAMIAESNSPDLQLD